MQSLNYAGPEEQPVDAAHKRLAELLEKIDAYWPDLVNQGSIHDSDVYVPVEQYVLLSITIR